MFGLSLVQLCPCWILYPWCNYLSVVVLVECSTCKWYFALSLLACMSRCSFLVWMIIVITIYSDCSCLVNPCLIVILFIAWSHCTCSICISRFLLTMIVLCYCFQENLSVWFKSFTEFRVRCEWVFATIPNLHFKSKVCFRILSRNSQRGDCKIEFIQSCVGFILC